MYRLSIAQVQFMAVDNTHTKYLHGSDKKAWNGYGEALKSQKKLDNFMDGLFSSKKLPELKEGEEFEIPVRKNNKGR